MWLKLYICKEYRQTWFICPACFDGCWTFAIGWICRNIYMVQCPSLKIFENNCCNIVLCCIHLFCTYDCVVAMSCIIVILHDGHITYNIACDATTNIFRSSPGNFSRRVCDTHNAYICWKTRCWNKTLISNAPYFNIFKCDHDKNLILLSILSVPGGGCSGGALCALELITLCLSSCEL